MKTEMLGDIKKKYNGSMIIDSLANLTDFQQKTKDTISFTLA